MKLAPTAQLERDVVNVENNGDYMSKVWIIKGKRGYFVGVTSLGEIWTSDFRGAKRFHGSPNPKEVLSGRDEKLVEFELGRFIAPPLNQITTAEKMREKK